MTSGEEGTSNVADWLPIETGNPLFAPSERGLL